MHPWSLHLPDERPAIGIINTDFHELYPWSLMRWDFVMTAMQARCESVLVGTTDQLVGALAGKRMDAINTLNAFYNDLIERVILNAQSAPRAFANPTTFKRSFTSFWNNVSRESFPA